MAPWSEPSGVSCHWPGSTLKQPSGNLRRRQARGPAEGLENLHSAVAAWGTNERSVREAPEWPYNANLVLRLGASALFPTIVYLLKVLFGVRLTP